MARAWPWALLPLLLLSGLVAVFVTVRPLDFLSAGMPPVEDLTVERIVLKDGEITATVRAEGSEPLRIAQVLVDDAYRVFTQTPEGPIPRLGTARIVIPYPWVAGESHELLFLTSTGLTFGQTIDVAVPTPEWSLRDMAALAAVGLLVGIVPVGLGMLFYPALRSGGRRGLEFVLALTIGLLTFLFVDTLGEGLESAAAATEGFKPHVLVWLAALATFLLLMAVGRRGGRQPEGVALSAYIALGIGLHNLGEGLAIGASFAAGEAALASFLVLGFTLHNVTEGIGIAAPLVGQRPRLTTFAALAALAGLPAVLGTWGGAFAYSPHWVALCFGIGAGAILQVIVEVGAFLRRSSSSEGSRWLTGTGLAGFGAGVAAMYGTALLVPA